MNSLNELTPSPIASGMPFEDPRLVAEDEVEAEVEDGLSADLLAQAMDGLGQRLVVGLVGQDEREDRAEPGLGGGQRPASPVVVLGAEMHVAIDGAGEDDLAGGVDGPLGRRQILDRPQGHDAPVANAHGSVEDLDRRDDASAGDDEVQRAGRHDVFLTGSVIWP